MGSLAHSKLAAMASSLGATRLMAFSLGTTRVIISSHPETAKEILSGSAFSDRPIKESARLLMFERAIGFAPSGNYWRNLLEVRKEMEEKGIVMLRGIFQKGSRRCYELAGKVKSVLGEIVRERKAAEDLNSGSDFLSALLSLPEQEQLSESDMVPVLWVKSLPSANNFFHILILGIASYTDYIIGKFTCNRENNSHCWIYYFVAVYQEMIFRGTDTVAILLEWIMARIVMHQEIQAKAQQELDTCIGFNRQVQDSDIPNLPYLQAIVKEVLRMPSWPTTLLGPPCSRGRPRRQSLHPSWHDGDG
ncbi:hypothetical protein GH714_029588 [Hevea brasiliensis]|uniref:Cytochrome P450 n=1 Tax=Hevea brasiliensis TaxID=3981 RepID=A0A6A6KXZ2_HEVBR|nr:hypothetical protein GH714_029588 [Hevea brasiliensis]